MTGSQNSHRHGITAEDIFISRVRFPAQCGFCTLFPKRAALDDSVRTPAMSELSSTLAGKRDRLLELLQSYGSCAVAFSGGLDSARLAKAARMALGDRAVAVTGVSASLAVGELDQCRELARQIGIRHEVVPTNELASPGYAANAPDRCYFCKAELFLQVEKLAERLGAAVVADGSNSDDRGEHRPGPARARQRKVLSPLGRMRTDQGGDSPTGRGLGVAGLEQAGHALPEQPHRLRRARHARAAGDDRPGGSVLRERGFQPLRVRYHKGDMARIEVSPDALAKFLDAEFRRETIERLKALGFKYVSLDLEGFRSGSLNAVVPMERLEVAGRRPETPPPSGAAAGQRPS